MININTILSVFDERGTLLKWLKDVEKTINTDTLKVIELVETDSYNFKLKFVFGDDSVIYTPLITIPKTTATSLLNLMEGNDTIIIDLDESTNKVELHIDNNLLNKINNSLQLPSVAPSELMAVCIDTSNGQTLKAVSDLSGKFYIHNITISNLGDILEITIISSDSTPITKETFNDNRVKAVNYNMKVSTFNDASIVSLCYISSVAYNSDAPNETLRNYNVTAWVVKNVDGTYTTTTRVATLPYNSTFIDRVTEL